MIEFVVYIECEFESDVELGGNVNSKSKKIVPATV